MRAIVGSLGLVLVLTACGGTASTEAAPSPPPPSATPTPSPSPAKTKAKGPNVSGCYTRDDGNIFTYGDDMPGVITGKGETGVVITYERRGNVCTWRPLSDRLVAAGYRVLLYARKSTDLPEDTALAMAGRLAGEKGVKRVFLAGGSIGGTVSATAALALGEKVAGVISLSGSIEAADAAGLKVPLLQIGTEHDDYGGADDLQAAHDAATRAPDRQLHVIKGERTHASELFRGPYATEVIDRVVAFMDRHKG